MAAVMADGVEDIAQCRDGKQVVFNGIHNTILHSKHQLPNKTWCVARLQDGQVYVFDSSGDCHAEVQMMKKLFEVYYKKRKLLQQEMTFYSNYTPCADCSDYLLEQLTKEMSRVHLTFIAACPYRINRQSCPSDCKRRICMRNESKHEEGLKKLKSAKEYVTLRAFKMADW